jgi:hypothetical protein
VAVTLQQQQQQQQRKGCSVTRMAQRHMPVKRHSTLYITILRRIARCCTGSKHLPLLPRGSSCFLASAAAAALCDA